ncbi:hypothetical protein D1B31_15455 [Neobacillus notoginsengisoli]|uniref:Uncharacterized protein n=1 Tax=Neobacillus notoginsengisoli TaxID=1578198 RepID=A0A417YSD9_9BACI|nr:hypothetical protein [Neobacillus notoginsengisoli]RHW38165.1 hypothetical protein D1B31_15455 [Neobacillus notoginsengisoli]
MDNIKSYTSVVFMILIDFIILLGVLSMFFKVDNTIIAGMLGFIGAIIGGGITYLGVKKTLLHREREKFLADSSKLIFSLEDTIKLISPFLNNFGYKEMFNIKTRDSGSLGLLREFEWVIEKEYTKLREIHDYDFITILSFHIKSYSFELQKVPPGESLSEESMDVCIDKLRTIFGILTTQRKLLEKQYYQYKKQTK